MLQTMTFHRKVSASTNCIPYIYIYIYIYIYLYVQFPTILVVALLGHVQLFGAPWTAACQTTLSFTISRSLLKLMSIDSVMPSNSICYSLLLLPSIFPSIRVFSNESTLHIRWLKYWSIIFSISPSDKYPGLISHHFKANRWRNSGNSDKPYWAPKSLQMVTAAMKLKDSCSLEQKL